MGRKRKNHSQEFKAKVALEAVKGLHTLSELASRYKVHSTQIAQWKRQLVENAAENSGTVNHEALPHPLTMKISTKASGSNQTANIAKAFQHKGPVSNFQDSNLFLRCSVGMARPKLAPDFVPLGAASGQLSQTTTQMRFQLAAFPETAQLRPPVVVREEDAL